MLQRNLVLNWINDHFIFSYACSNTFSSFPMPFSDCSSLRRLSPSELREWSLLLCPRSGWYSYSSSWLLQTTLYLSFPISHSSFLEVIQNTAAKTFNPRHGSDSDLHLNITSQPPGVMFSDLHLSLAQLRSSAKCCQCGLLLGLLPAVASVSCCCPKPAAPFLATSSLHSSCTGWRNTFVLSCFLK